MTAKVTMQDIADKLHISKSLVSRALADKYGVSDSMRTEIRLTAVAMGYELPNANRRNGNAKSDHTISVMVRRDIFNDMFFYKEMLDGIEKAVREKNMLLSLIIIEDQDTTIINTRNIHSDGLIVLGLMSTENVAAVISMGKAVVLLDTFNPRYRVNRISSNNYDGCYHATDFVIKHGHKHLCFVGDIGYSSSFSSRHSGFRARVAEDIGSLRITEVLEHREHEASPFCIKQFKQVMTALDHPTALVCANDAVAVAVYEILDELHLTVPDDVSVIGFDNNAHAEKLTPALTTMSVPRSAMGRLAVERLWKQVTEPKTDQRVIEYTQVDVDLVERDSVAFLHS